jgi:hypothetical protein
MTPQEHLQAIVSILSAALEHSPPITRELLGRSAQANIKVLEELINGLPKQEP